MILVLFAWLNGNGFTGEATQIWGGLFGGFSWLIPVCEIVMLSVFIYWFYHWKDCIPALVRFYQRSES